MLVAGSAYRPSSRTTPLSRLVATLLFIEFEECLECVWELPPVALAVRGVTIAVALAIFPLKAELPGALVAGLPGCAAGVCAGRFGAAAEAATADGFSFFPWGAADLPCAPVVFLSGAAAGLPRPCAAFGRAAAGLRVALAGAGALPRIFVFAALLDATGAAACLPEAGLRFGAGAAFAKAGLRLTALTAAGAFFAVGLGAGLAFAAVRAVFVDCGFAAALAGLRDDVALPAGLAARFGGAFFAADLAGLATRSGAGLPTDFFAGLPPLVACAFTFAVTDFAFAVAWTDVRDLPFVCELAEPASLFLFAISSHHALAVAAGFYNPSILYRQARIWNTGAHASPRLLGQVNPLTRLILWMLHLYKRMLSPLLGPRCRFHPSCSDYARIAVMRFGPWRGSLLAAWRLLRCQPLCAGGDDPVPESFHFPHCKRQGDPPDGH